MFRRDPGAVKSWERYGVETTVTMQRDILIQADRMLAPGGSIVYSTCTFSEEENEKMAEWFMSTCKGYEVISHSDVPQVSFSSVAGNPNGAIRLWPHRSRGEGHFCVHMRKRSDLRNDIAGNETLRFGCDFDTGFPVPDCVTSFFQGLLTEEAAVRFLGRLKRFGNMTQDRLHIHKLPGTLYQKLHAIKIGAYCGDIRYLSGQTMFVPSSSLASSLRAGDIRPERLVSLERTDNRVERYLKGETIFPSSEESQKIEDRAFVVIAVDGFPLGFAKYLDHMFKNQYSKSWRVL
jgi:hypothetical protein